MVARTGPAVVRSETKNVTRVEAHAERGVWRQWHAERWKTGSRQQRPVFVFVVRVT